METVNIILKSILFFLRRTNGFLQFLFFITIIIGFWFFDNSLGFIRNYRNSNKIEQIKSLENIIQTPKIDTKTKLLLQNLENEIIQRESLLERLYLQGKRMRF
jgi:hypothetical protein